MAGMYLNFPFDEEIFNTTWKNTPNLTHTRWLESGVMVEDGEIARMISNGSDTFTTPFYNNLTQTDATNYDGKTDIQFDTLDGHTQTGIVYGRSRGWIENEFVKNYNSGANPMVEIAKQVQGYWARDDQKVLRGIVQACLENGDMASHVINTGEMIDATVLGDAKTEVFGENAEFITMAIMHSRVARKLANLQLLEYRKYTDPQGIERKSNIADIDGMTVIIDDSVPVVQGEEGAPNEYTTYLLTRGAIGHASAPVTTPVELDRDPVKNGGMNMLITRRRQAIHPYGFNFIKPKSGYTASATNAQLFNKANWKLVGDHKTVGMMAVTCQA